MRDDFDPENPEQAELGDALSDLTDLTADPDDAGGDAGDELNGPRLIILDVEAVVRGSQQLSESWDEDRVGAVHKLANVLSWAMAHQNSEFVLVLEASARLDDVEVETAHLRQHSPAEGETVSRALLDLAEEGAAAGRAVTVVTSDVYVLRFAAEEKIQSNLADLFAASLMGGAAAGEDDVFVKPRGLTARQSAEWDAFVLQWRTRAKQKT